MRYLGREIQRSFGKVVQAAFSDVDNQKLKIITERLARQIQNINGSYPHVFRESVLGSDTSTADPEGQNQLPVLGNSGDGKGG